MPIEHGVSLCPNTPSSTSTSLCCHPWPYLLPAPTESSITGKLQLFLHGFLKNPTTTPDFIKGKADLMQLIWEKRNYFLSH